MRIESDIVLCVLAPGVRVTESQLGERYGVGCAGVRATIKQLFDAKSLPNSRR